MLFACRPEKEPISDDGSVAGDHLPALDGKYDARISASLGCSVLDGGFDHCATVVRSQSFPPQS